MKTFLFELCAETLNAAKVADQCGANRIELCTRLDIGGITPDEQLTTAVLQALSIPVHVLIRPRGGNFFYTTDEFEQMRQQVQWVKQAGAAGVALGVLLPDGRIDVSRNRELLELARPMNVTFHRAFDRAPDLDEALEAVISVGADCILTSGGAPNVLAGADQLEKLVRQAGSRIQIMAGGGLKLASMLEVLERTGLSCLHGSLARAAGECILESASADTPVKETDTLDADVRTAVRLMRNHFDKREVAAQAMR